MEKRMFQVFAEVEKQMIKDRTRAALAVKKARGERVGNVPYGYRLSEDGVHVEPNTEEQAIIAIICSLRALGMTFYGIVAYLNQEGIPNRKGTMWQYRSVWNIVNSIA
jgi:DNA invertase Pin-like site-specific DNA recombinase